MDIVVTSRDQDPANFLANYMDSINLNGGYEIALKSLFHAPIYNITENHNRFSVAKSNDGTGSTDQLNLTIAHFEIPIGFYESRCEIVTAMHKAMADTIDGIQLAFVSTNPHNRDILNRPPIISIDNGTIILDMANPKKGRDSTMIALRNLEYKYFVIDPAVYIDSSLMNVLGYCQREKTFLPKIEVQDFTFTNSSAAGFLYSNIVGNTMIDQNQSRLLATVPMKSKAGYNFFEFQNPTYRTLSVHSITEMSFVITDVEGATLKMDNIYLRRRNFSEWIFPTILNLHIRKRL